jgi:hypothetical protein
VEKSWQNKARRDPHEEIEVFRKPDRKYPEISRSGHGAGRTCPLARILQRIFLQIEAKYSGISASGLKQLKELEEENRRHNKDICVLEFGTSSAQGYYQKSSEIRRAA